MNLCAHVQLIEVDTQTAGRAEAHASRQVAGAEVGAVDADAKQGVVAATGKTVADSRIECRQAAVLGESQLHRGAAGGAARVGVERDDLFVQATEARFDDAFENRVAVGTTRAVDDFVGRDRQLSAADVTDGVADPHVELDRDAFQIVVVGAVDHVAEVEGHDLAAIGVGHDGQPARVEHAVGRQSRQVGSDRQGLRAVLVAVDVERAADDQVGVAGQSAVGNEGNAQRIHQGVR
ncbi:hypothetical protein D3C85_582250 [compost metagenome]